MFTRIDRYVLRQILGPLFMTLGIAALLLILERMLRLFDFVINQGGPVGVVFRMLANLTPHYMGLALPVGLFLGVLMAFRKLSLSSEYDALQTAGVGLPRMMRPILMLSLVLMVINTLLVGWVQPYSRYAYRGLVFDLRSGALGASVRVGEFVEIGDDMVLRIEVSNQDGAELEGIFLERLKEDGSVAISAARGGFFNTGDEQSVLLRLYDGVLIDVNERQNKPRVLQFDRQDIAITLPESAPFRDRGGEEREMTLPELYREQANPRNTRAVRDAYTGSLHWRIMHSLTFLVLPLLAAPLGLTNKRTGRGTGIVVGVSLLIVYNELMEVMESLVADGRSPFLTIWALFAMFLGLSLVFFRTASLKAGGEPLGWIDSLWSRLSAPLTRLMKTILGIRS